MISLCCLIRTLNHLIRRDYNGEPDTYSSDRKYKYINSNIYIYTVYMHRISPFNNCITGLRLTSLVRNSDVTSTTLNTICDRV